jgi:hypothetical protein
MMLGYAEEIFLTGAEFGEAVRDYPSQGQAAGIPRRRDRRRAEDDRMPADRAGLPVAGVGSRPLHTCSKLRGT